MTVLVTGATGFLGSHLVHALLAERFEVVILKRSTSNTWRIDDVMGEVKSYNIGTQNLEKAFKKNKISTVIHTACNYGRNQESNTKIIETNLLFGLKLLELSIKYKVDTFINTDTFLNKNVNSYSMSKKQFYEWLPILSDKIQIINLKIEHIYGTKDGSSKFVPWVLSQLFEKVDRIKLTEGEQMRDFIFIDDIVSVYLTIIDKRDELLNYSDIDVGTGEFISVKNFVCKIKKIYEQEVGPSFTKLSFGSIPYRNGEIMNIKLNNQKLLDLGWKPTYTYDKGLKKIIDTYEN